MAGPALSASDISASAIIVGLDFGTSGVKLTALTLQGASLLNTFAGYPTRTGVTAANGSPIAGATEQDPADWWGAARIVCARLSENGLAAEVVALGVTGQMQDLVPVAPGVQDFAVRPALLYSDTRAAAEHASLRAALSEWEARTENHQDGSNVAAKIAWLAGQEPASLAAAEHLLLGAPGYVAWRAAGAAPSAALCDVVTASTTGLLDVAGRGWDAAVLAAAGAHPGQLPRLSGSGPESIAGPLAPIAARELGLPEGIPVVHAMGDAGATTDGLVGSSPGDAYLYLGASGWLAAVTPAALPGTAGAAPSPIHSLVMPGWGSRLRIGAVQSAGSASAWALATFFPGLSFAEAEARVAPRLSTPAAIAARPLVLPGLGGERTPVRDSALRGAFVGVTDETLPEDLYLGVLTGVAMGLRHAADAMGIHQERLPLVGGGSQSHAWRQICADVFGATIVTGESDGSIPGAGDDPGSRSAARAAAHALGLSHSIEPLLTAHAGNATVLRETAPGQASAPLIERLPVHRALYDALTPTFRWNPSTDQA